MKYILIIFSFLTTIFAQTNIVVSIAPQQTFVEKIGGDKVSVSTMVRAGSDPHSYEPKPSQMIDISKANIYFPIGLEFENTWLDKFANQNKDMQFVEMTKDIEKITMKSHHHHDERHDNHKEHHEHKAHSEHEKLPYEWAGVFELKKEFITGAFLKLMETMLILQ